jgi:hypothetical protein
MEKLLKFRKGNILMIHLDFKRLRNNLAYMK